MAKLPKREIPITRTADGILEVLYDEMDAFLDGKVDSKHASTVSKLSNSVIRALPFQKQPAEGKK